MANINSFRKSLTVFILLMVSFLFIGGCDWRGDKNLGDSVYMFKNNPLSDLYTPIIEMDLNGKPQFWVIDTGANLSLIDQNFFNENEKDFHYLDNIDMTLNGISGSMDYQADYVGGVMGKGAKKFYHNFLTSDLTGVIDNIRDRNGIEIAGIIGADFLSKYKYAIDFKNELIFIQYLPSDSIVFALERTDKK